MPLNENDFFSSFDSTAMPLVNRLLSLPPGEDGREFFARVDKHQSVFGKTSSEICLWLMYSRETQKDSPWPERSCLQSVPRKNGKNAYDFVPLEIMAAPVMFIRAQADVKTGQVSVVSQLYVEKTPKGLRVCENLETKKLATLEDSLPIIHAWMSRFDYIDPRLRQDVTSAPIPAFTKKKVALPGRK